MKVLTAVAVAGLVLAAAAAAGNAVATDTPFTGSMESCTGESVALEGTEHTTTEASTSSGKLQFHVTDHTSAMSAVTLSGARYVYSDTTSDTTTADFDSVPSEFTSERTMVLNRVGEDGGLIAGDDMYIHTLVHVTVNANGVPTADVGNFTAECR